MKPLNLVFLFALALAFTVVTCREAATVSQKTEKGIIDLRNWNADSGEVVRLNGDWEFFWDETFASIKQKKNLSPEYIPVPGSWADNSDHPATGKAVYRIKILTSTKFPVFALKIYEFPEAYRVYVNGNFLLENGKYSPDPSLGFRSLVRPVAVFPNENNSSEIAIEVVSLKQRDPGPRRAILFGREKDIRSVQENQIISDMLTGGVLLIMGLYHLGLYFQRKKEKGSFLFGLYCLLMTFRICVTEEHYLHKYFPEFPDRLEWRLDVLSFLVLPPIVTAIFANFFRHEFHQRILFPALFIFGLFTIVYTISPGEYIFTAYIGFSLLTSLYLGFVLFRGVVRKRPGSIVFLLGWIIFSGTAVLDFLSYSNITRTIYVSHIGFLFFVFSQAYFLSIRFNNALSTAEELTGRLEINVRQRTEELNYSLDIIHKDLSLAKKIQEELLKRKIVKFPQMNIVEKYIPVSEVGGDIYDIREIHPGKFRIFLADATGHGVQAAFVTMMIKSEYDNLDLPNLLPNGIIESFNKSYSEKYKSLLSFFSCFILDIDLDKKMISFSSGGHPDQLLIRGNDIIPLQSGGPMVGIKTASSYRLDEIPLFPRDRFLIFTDGLFEEFNSRNEIYGEERLRKSVQDFSEKSISDLTELVLKEVENFLGQRSKDDDITILAIELK
ncbi:MAG: SpoIIE family protein phosphatase [Leptospira sp.]|nr:SpoIIE family protein phosphatase [Leptospira sp.]